MRPPIISVAQIQADHCFVASNNCLHCHTDDNFLSDLLAGKLYRYLSVVRSRTQRNSELKKLLLLAACIGAGSAVAETANVNTGSSMGTGPSSNIYSLQSAASNPAMNSLVVSEDHAWRFSYFPSFGVSAELGDVENFSDDLDELIDIIDDASATQDSVSDVLDRFNNTLQAAGESGYIKGTVGFGLPLPRFVHRSDKFGASFGVSASVQRQVSLSLLDSALSFDEQNGTFATATSLYLKSGIEKSVAFSYSKPLLSVKNNRLLGEPKLYAGLTAKIISLELSKQVSPLQQLEGRNISSVLEDEYDSNLNESTQLGLDAGVVWDAGKYRLGLTLQNINSPSFDYGDIGTDCESREENSASRSSCEAARLFIQQRGEIQAGETHRMSARTRVDGLYHFNPKWFASASLDLARYNDIVGFENQWLHVATAYQFNNNILPSLRVGLQKNLAGEKLASLTMGMNLFKYVSLDMEYGLESTSFDDTSTPRRFGIALGVEEKF